MESPPKKFHGFMQLSMGLQDASGLDSSFSWVRGKDSEQNFFPYVIILMVGGNDWTSAIASALGVASDIHELALSLAAAVLVKR